MGAQALLVSAPEEVAVAKLKLELSPRSEARDADHIRTLAGVFDELPPIIVHEATNQVIDGTHRVLAARQLGRSTICAVLRSGTVEDAFVEAVQANVTHGKPLSLSERRAAARRVLAMRPDWSDRRVSAVCGLSSQAVAAVRSRCGASGADAAGRVGRDERVRPVDPVGVRQRVAEVLAVQPGAKLRDVATRVGTSQATVLDVRRRLARGDSPLPPRLAGAARNAPLTADAALVATPSGRDFADWFEAHRIGRDDIERAEGVPLSRAYELADEARRQSALWAELAGAFEKRVRESLRDRR